MIRATISLAFVLVLAGTAVTWNTTSLFSSSDAALAADDALASGSHVRSGDVWSIWTKEPPGEPLKVGAERDMTKPSDELIAGRRVMRLGNVSSPEAHVYLPPEDKRTGSAVVICPGGGFTILAWDLEGTEVATWLNDLGVAAIVLKYRVPTRKQSESWLAPTQDLQRTVSMVRANAKRLGIEPDRVGVLGFSAGGVTAVQASLAKHRLYEPSDRIDEQPCRPDRSILIYAGGLPEEATPAAFDKLGVTEDAPPMFIAHAFDDFVPVEGTANMLLALKRAGVASELHVYDRGGHGYGLRPVEEFPVTTWTQPCEAWLRRAGWLGR